MGNPLLIHRDPDADWFAAYQNGVVDDGQPDRNWHVISEHCRLLYSEPGGSLLGFGTREFTELDLDLLEEEGLFEGPRFDVPVLGLRNATIGEVCIAARAYLGAEATLDVAYFDMAVHAQETGDLEEARQLWRLCLEAGNMDAHYGLGYTLLDLGRAHAGYRHLRFYTELAPCNSWAWCYRGKAAEAIGDQDEARGCYERAVELEQAGGFETDAPELLAELGASR